MLRQSFEEDSKCLEWVLEIPVLSHHIKKKDKIG